MPFAMVVSAALSKAHCESLVKWDRSTDRYILNETFYKGKKWDSNCLQTK